MNKFETWINKQIDYYKPKLGLQLYKINIKQEDVSYIEIACNYPYLEAELQYSHKVLKDWERGVLHKRIILHELLHLITEPLYCKAIQRSVSENEIEAERERLTDILTMIYDKNKKF